MRKERIAQMEADEPIPTDNINYRRIADVMNKLVFNKVVPKEDGHFVAWVEINGKIVKMNAEEFKEHQKRLKG